MCAGSPSAYLLWSILSILVRCPSNRSLPASDLHSQFWIFFLAHLWTYDRFQCVKWDSGRQPGAFRRFMTYVPLRALTVHPHSFFSYSYLGSVPLLVIFNVGITCIKYKEGAASNPSSRCHLPINISRIYNRGGRRQWVPCVYSLSKLNRSSSDTDTVLSLGS